MSSNSTLKDSPNLIQPCTPDESLLYIHVKHNTTTHNITIDRHATVAMLKHQIELLSHVTPSTQKLIRSKLGNMRYTDQTQLHELFHDHSANNTIKIMLIGQPAAVHNHAKSFDSLQLLLNQSIFDDLDTPDTQYDTNTSNSLLTNKKIQNKLSSAVHELTINYINPSRPGKHLLVLDIDYTIYDMKSNGTDFNLLRRPYTDHMLATLYTQYDICFWSQTNWRYLEAKLTELGILTHTNYKILFVLDKSSMFRIESTRNNQPYKHYVKPLHVIWAHCKQYNATNTLHIDDLSRNFALNIRNGIQCTPYKHCQLTHQNDNELLLITRYIQYITETCNDFSKLDHTRWKAQLISLAPTQ